MPFGAAAQRKPRRVALLSVGSVGQWGSLRDALEALRTDIVYDARSADGRFDQLEKLAMDVVRSRPDVIVAHDTPAVMAARKATTRIPIVMAPGADAGGNVTGVTVNAVQVAERVVQLIREVKSNARRIALLANADDPSTRVFASTLNQAATRIRVPVGVTRVRTADDYEAAFAQWERLRLQALIVHPSVDKARAAELALRYRVPAIALAFGLDEAGFVEAGGLMSYSASPRELGRKTAGFVDRILKGAKPATLPVEQLTAFHLALNLKTARALEVEFSDGVLARADAVLQ